jgi:alkylation response protein AidB-like acyl-CoA dehydrogenase
MESPIGQSIILAFSEPNHGSDLAAIETWGEIRGNEIIVTGVKAWIPRADHATSVLVLCRTGPVAARHRNLSCVLLPLHDNNVELRPQRKMSGDGDLFEVILDGARAPLSNVIGGLDNGWRVAMTIQALTRSGQATSGDLEREFWDLVETARQYGRDRDPLVRQQLALAYAQMKIIRWQRPDVEPSIAHLLWSEYHRRLGEMAMDIIGASALLRPDGEAYATSRWQHVFLSSRADTISSGTSEIQRNSVAERVLGLPK